MSLGCLAIVDDLVLKFVPGDALLLGGRAAIAPLLQPAAPLRDARRTGDVVYTMPDGVFCRHLTFDNVTGNIREGSLEPCVNTLAKLDNREVPAFARANH